MVLKIVPIQTEHPDFTELVSQLDRYLETLYPQDEIFTVDFQEPGIESGIFVVAYWGDQPVGCGGLRPLNETEMELKRFYVNPLYRRQGIARELLAYLEQEAKNLGYVTVKLETGDQQPEAIQFYERYGYNTIPSYGEYIGCESSRCYEKQL